MKSYNPTWVALLSGLHEEPVRLRPVINGRTYELTICFSRQRYVLNISCGGKVRQLPLLTLMSEMRPTHLSLSLQRIWALLRLVMTREIALVDNLAVTATVAVSADLLRSRHLLPGLCAGSWFTLPTMLGTLSFLRTVQGDLVFLTLCLATPGHQLAQYVEDGKRVNITFMRGIPQRYLPGTPEQVLVEYLVKELIPLGGRKETVV